MTVDRTLSSQRQIGKLRVEHRAKAKLTAENGLVPNAFLGDPTFQELVSNQAKGILPALETGSSMLATVISDEPANDSG